MKRGGKLKPDVEKVADIVRDAGGEIVGRTRLQKIGYLLELAGLGDGFRFEYRHYGPYSESLAVATLQAQFLDLIQEEERRAVWGGSYSIFRADPSGGRTVEPERLKLIQEAMKSDPIALELAATAAFLADEGSANPWEETAERKPEKAQDRHMSNAKALYRRLLNIDTPTPLPRIL